MNTVRTVSCVINFPTENSDLRYWFQQSCWPAYVLLHLVPSCQIWSACRNVPLYVLYTSSLRSVCSPHLSLLVLVWSLVELYDFSIKCYRRSLRQLLPILNDSLYAQDSRQKLSVRSEAAVWHSSACQDWMTACFQHWAIFIAYKRVLQINWLAHLSCDSITCVLPIYCSILFKYINFNRNPLNLNFERFSKLVFIFTLLQCPQSYTQLNVSFYKNTQHSTKR